MENSLSCDDVENLLSPFFDNELSEQEFGVVKEHIENCPSCNEKLENIAKLSSVLKESFAKSA
ncbi:MAG: zf-HC2 domain-containing protein [Candidatus Moduliflexus flocculans]|nr:zf-HC2 domain-containing protein [Candidatus Moduliflexus flocculans]